jgi:hypothetical protein
MRSGRTMETSIEECDNARPDPIPYRGAVCPKEGWDFVGKIKLLFTQPPARRPPARAAEHGQDGGWVASAARAARGVRRRENGLFHRVRPSTLSLLRH